MNYRRLLNKVLATFATIETTGDAPEAVIHLAETIAHNFRDEFGITGGRLYEYHDGFFELTHRFGQSIRGTLGIPVSADYPPIAAAVENGIVVMGPDDPSVDKKLEQRLGAKRFAAISVGDDDYLVSFDVSPESSREDILFSLNIIRYAINQKLRAGHYKAQFGEARLIQQSILPQRRPEFPGFDVFGKIVPVDDVGGDFYDFLQISDNVLGLAIADATGHGLPAALVVRDIHMGLRMGVDRDLKMVRTLQKLNHIIHRSRLSTKFVSLFYGELESTGVFIYTNGGHNPPFHMSASETEWLRIGGPVLGPFPDASYGRGYIQMKPGDLLCLYSDGIVEAENRREQEFGAERLKRTVAKHRELSAQEICERVLARVEEWTTRQQDDRTIVIVKALAPMPPPAIPC